MNAPVDDDAAIRGMGDGPFIVRRRPGKTQAFPFNGDNAAELAEWAGNGATYEGGRLIIHTPQGDMTPQPGEVVIRGLCGEHYPITPEAYEAGWEVVTDG